MSASWRITLQLLRAQLRHAPLRMVLAGMIIGVAALCAVGFVIDRINQHIVRESASQLGGDIVLSSSYALPGNWKSSAQASGLSTSEHVRFSTMAAVGDAFQLASIKAVDPHYPLLGSIVLQSAQGDEQQVQNGPPRGEIWPEARLINALGAHVGDQVEIGYATFKISAVLDRDAGLAGGFYAMSPRALMHLDDVPSTKIIQPGSRVNYALAISGERAALDDWFSTINVSEDVQVTSPTQGGGNLQAAIGRSAQYFSTANLLTIILTGITIAIAATSYAYNELPNIALIRCLGLSGKGVRRLVVQQMLILALVGWLIGALIGYFAHLWLIDIFASLINAELPAPSIMPVIMGLITALVFGLGFAAIPILRAATTPPLRVLRNDISPAPVRFWWSLAFGALAIMALLWLQTRDLELTLKVGGGALAVLGVVLGFLVVVLRVLPAHRLPTAFKTTLGHLRQTPWISALQITGFALFAATLGLVLMLNYDAIERWRGELPDEAPNRFVFNLVNGEPERFSARLNQYGIPSPEYYPIVRGRLTHINAQPVRDAVTKETAQQEDALNRDLSLTFSSTLPPDNAILSGAWWDNTDADGRRISLEEEVAQNLGIVVGDTLTFSIGTQQVSASVTSIRSVVWENFKPNFYVIFAPGDLDNFATNWLTSFYLKSDVTRAVERDLRTDFPSMTMIDVDSTLSEVRTIIDKVSTAITSILTLTFAASIVLFLTALYTSTRERMQESTIFRLLGATRQTIRARLVSEFALLGILSGAIAAIIIVIAGGVLYNLLDIDASAPLQYWIVWPFILALVLCAAGWRFANQIANGSPLSSLRDTI